MITFHTLQNVFEAFNFFSIDFKVKERNNATIYYALDNDIFNFALFPLKGRNPIHANLFDQEEDDDFLMKQSMQLAISLSKLAKRESLIVMPSHSIEYKNTVYELFSKYTHLQNTSIDIPSPEKLSEILSEIVQEDDNETIVKRLDKEIPNLLIWIEKFTELEFAKKQYFNFMNNNGKKNIQPFMSLLKRLGDFNIDESLKDIDINFFQIMYDYREKKIIKRQTELKKELDENLYEEFLNLEHKISKYAVSNDTKALEYIIAFNQEHEDKKIILLTGDKSINAAYRKYYKKYLKPNDIYAVRYPKYLMPFLTGDDSIFSVKKKNMIEKISDLSRDYKETSKGNTDKESSLILNEAKHIIKKLETIINYNDFMPYIKKIELETSAKKNIDILLQKILKKEDFKEYFMNKIKEDKKSLMKAMSLIPVFEEIVNHQEYVSKKKQFFRYPFIINANSNAEQELINTFMNDILKGKLTSNIINIQKKLSKFNMFLLYATVLNILKNKEKALLYVKAAQRENFTDNTHINKNECFLLECFIYRTNLKDKNDFFESKNALNKIPENSSSLDVYRKDIEHVLLDTTYILFKEEKGESDDKDKLVKEINRISQKLIDLQDKHKDIFINLEKNKENKIQERAKTQIFMNMLTIYLYSKYSLSLNDSEMTLNKDFLSQYKSFFYQVRDKNKVAYVNIMIAMFDISLYINSEEKSMAKFEARKSINKVLNDDNMFLQDHERNILKIFLTKSYNG